MKDEAGLLSRFRLEQRSIEALLVESFMVPESIDIDFQDRLT